MKERASHVLWVDNTRWNAKPPEAPGFTCADCGVCCGYGSPEVVEDDLSVVPSEMVDEHTVYSSGVAMGRTLMMLKNRTAEDFTEGHVYRVRDDAVTYVHITEELRAPCCAHDSKTGLCTLHGDGDDSKDRRPKYCRDASFPVGCWGCQAMRQHSGLPVSEWWHKERSKAERAVKNGRFVGMEPLKPEAKA